MHAFQTHNGESIVLLEKFYEYNGESIVLLEKF